MEMMIDKDILRRRSRDAFMVPAFFHFKGPMRIFVLQKIPRGFMGLT
jgi:hypothetical protein